MEKPGIEPATPGLQGIALIHYTTGASLICRKQIPAILDIHMCKALYRVKPGFIGRQGSSDRSFYVSFTALTTDTCLERSYPFVLATNLLSDTAVKICIARVITPCSHWIKASSEKTRLVLKGFLQNGAEKKHRDSSPVYFNILSKGFLH